MTYFRVKPFPCWPVAAEEALKAPIEDELFDYKEVHDYHIPYEILELVDVKESDTFMWCGMRVACPDKVTVLYENIAEIPCGLLLKYRYYIMITPRDTDLTAYAPPIIIKQDRDIPLTRRDWQKFRREAFFYMKMLPNNPAMRITIERMDRGNDYTDYVACCFLIRHKWYKADHWFNWTPNLKLSVSCFVEKSKSY